MFSRFLSRFFKPVPPGELKNIVPYECNDGFVGVDFMRQLASEKNGIFCRDTKGIGLMDDFGVLQCDLFDPAKVHPIVRDFYENTIDYSIDVSPRWNPFFKPAYWLFRRLVFEKIGNANLPFDDIEAAQGITSHIDTIDLDHNSTVDLRGWVRLYTESQKVIYVGIYTTISLDDKCYVSVGFPFQSVNLTATLAPINHEGDSLLLSSKKNEKFKFAGDYLASINEDGSMSAHKLKWFREEIHVFVKEGKLLTDHRFYFLKCNFLTLHYRITPKPSPPKT